ncbi:MAG: hypothetical protein ACE37F_22785 [Nannocystaceae bacterium]|nr:hypothetical protein [bacterium]
MSRLSILTVTLVLAGCADASTPPREAEVAAAPQGVPVAPSPRLDVPAELPPPPEAPRPAVLPEPLEPSQPSKPEVADALPEDAAAAAPEVEIVAWSCETREPQWTSLATPAEPVSLVLLDRGVLGRAKAGWFQLDEADAFTGVELSRDPTSPIVGMWPDDAWFVQERFRKYGGVGEEYLELRLMRLRGGKRWVPQVFSGSGEQWFHPGTDDELTPRMSRRSGMLVYGTLDDITRVGGKHDDPVVGPHRGEAIDFIETGRGLVYVLSVDDGSYYAQTECADEACVSRKAQRLPLSGWQFGRDVPRGKWSVSVLASAGEREFVLHHRGKSGGWVLDELPGGQKPSFTWASQEGSLWTQTGESLRLRDTEGRWFDVTLPKGLASPSFAVTSDRARVVVAGLAAGKPGLWSTAANVELGESSG